MIYLTESSVKSVVTIFKQLAEVVKNTGDVITKIARNKTENQNILEAGEFVRNQTYKKIPVTSDFSSAARERMELMNCRRI